VTPMDFVHRGQNGAGRRSDGRRAFDVVVAGAALLVATPVLAAAAVAIRLESRGHVLYRQRRVGMGGREFDVLKLRTMVTGAEAMGAGLAVDEGDSRITRVGAVLRRTSIDELPNLVNVLRGEMAIVGPRPTVPVQVAQYTDRQRGRLAVRPGITGWAQVNGRASLPWHERIELDLWYVEHRSWRLDLEIIARTAHLVVGGDGLYKGETGGWRKT
jgi:lipopolysaccharide/colanic/teichoic acid biosynthesis glycosyltransferase